MFPESVPLDRVSELIRLALTPAFLIAAVSSMLGVLTSRLARVADQAVAIRKATGDSLVQSRSQRSMAARNIAARAWLLLGAMALSVVCTLLVTVVIALLYWAHRGFGDLSGAIGLLFVLSIAMLAMAMLCLLAEVGFASSIVRTITRDLGPEREGL